MSILIKKTRTVYILSSMLFNKSYIGSTGKTLTCRLSEHKNKSNTTTCKEVTKHGDLIIVPLLIIENCTKREIELKEQEFIKLYQDTLVNKHSSYRTKEEYLQQNKESKVRNNNHNTLVKSTKYNCVCGGQYTRNHKATHFKTIKHLTFLSKH